MLAIAGIRRDAHPLRSQMGTRSESDCQKKTKRISRLSDSEAGV